MIHNYPLYIAIWFAATVFLLWWFRIMTRKTRETDDRQTKSSLFTLMIFIGLPLLLGVVLFPMVFIIGDKNMDSLYRLIWGGLIFLFLVYFIIKQRTPKHEKH